MAQEGYWKPSYYIWCFNFALESDTPPPLPFFHPNFDHYANFKKGDIVWFDGGSLHVFQKDILSRIDEPIILILNAVDETFPTYFADSFDVNAFINDPRIFHIFAQNCDLGNSHPKVTQIPLGIDFHTWAWEWRKPRGEFISSEEQERVLKNIVSQLKPTYTRTPRIFADFQHQDRMKNSYNHIDIICGENRTIIFEKIVKTGLVDYTKHSIPRSKLWTTKGQYAFSVSPPGNGWDCHRTWEDLILGCIVIVKTSPLDPLYEGLPVVIVKDYSEITKENLKKWQKQYGDAFTNPSYREKLTHKYWMNKIRAKRDELVGQGP